MFNGRKLQRGKALRKQGLTGNFDKDGKQWYKVLLVQQPKATEESDIIFKVKIPRLSSLSHVTTPMKFQFTFVFRFQVKPRSFLYDYHDDPDVCDARTGEIKINREAVHKAGDALVDLHYDASASSSSNALRTF
jgi:hypothetical protein